MLPTNAARETPTSAPEPPAPPLRVLLAPAIRQPDFRCVAGLAAAHRPLSSRALVRHKKAVPAAPKPGDRSLMTPAQKKDADAKAMADKAAKKAGEPAAAPKK